MSEDYVSPGPQRRIEGVWMPMEKYKALTKLLEAAESLLEGLEAWATVEELEDQIHGLMEAVAQVEGWEQR